MEGAHVELGAKLLLRLVAQFADLEAADHISRRLTGIDDVALNGLHDAARRVGRIIGDIFDRLFAGPFLVVEA